MKYVTKLHNIPTYILLLMVIFSFHLVALVAIVMFCLRHYSNTDFNLTIAIPISSHYCGHWASNCAAHHVWQAKVARWRPFSTCCTFSGGLDPHGSSEKFSPPIAIFLSFLLFSLFFFLH